MSQTIAVAGTLFGSYATLWGLEYVWNLLVRAPKAIHAEQAGTIKERNAEIERLQSDPIEGAVEKARFQHISEALAECETDELRFLRWILLHGETEYTHFDQSGVPRAAISKLMGIAQKHQILKDRMINQGGLRVYRISPELEHALSAFLRSKGII